MAENETLWNWGNHQKYHADLENYIGTKITEHSSDVISHITADERTAWNGKTTIDECAETFINPSLIINSNFKINQRGQTTYPEGAKQYTVDAWRPNNNLTRVTVTDSGVTMLGVSSEGKLTSHFEADLSGKTVILSARINGKTYSVTGEATSNMNSWGAQLKAYPDDGGFFLLGGDGSTYYILISSPQDVEFSIEWVKLELGTVPTPYVDLDPALELVKCQRYFYRLGVGNDGWRLQGVALTETTAVVQVHFPTTMRTTPTVTHPTGEWSIVAYEVESKCSFWINEYNTTIVPDSYFGRDGGGLLITITPPSDNSPRFTVGAVITLSNNVGNPQYPGYIDFNAELA